MEDNQIGSYRNHYILLIFPVKTKKMRNVTELELCKLEDSFEFSCWLLTVEASSDSSSKNDDSKTVSATEAFMPILHLCLLIRHTLICIVELIPLFKLLFILPLLSGYLNFQFHCKMCNMPYFECNEDTKYKHTF